MFRCSVADNSYSYSSVPGQFATAALLELSMSVAQHALCGRPINAFVGNRHAVGQVLELVGHFLIAFFEKAFDHQ